MCCETCFISVSAKYSSSTDMTVTSGRHVAPFHKSQTRTRLQPCYSPAGGNSSLEREKKHWECSIRRMEAMGTGALWRPPRLRHFAPILYISIASKTCRSHQIWAMDRL